MVLHDAVPTITLTRDSGTGTPRDEITLGSPNSSQPFKLLHGAQGLGSAPVSLSTTPKLAGNGSVLRGKRQGEREIFLPLLLEAKSMSELNAIRERLGRLTSPLDPQFLRMKITTPGRDGYRETSVHYTGGLEGDFGDGYHGVWQRIGLQFTAVDHLWSGAPVTTPVSLDGARKPLLSTDPFFPVELSDSVVNGRVTLEVGGDAPTTAGWAIWGPGGDLLLRNLDTGQQFAMTGPFNEGEMVFLNMGTGKLSVSVGVEQNLWPRVSLTDSDMWNLKPGVNTMEVVLVGAGAGANVLVSYQPRYLAGY